LTFGLLPKAASADGVTFVESTYGLNFGCTPTSASPCLTVDNLSNGCPFCYASTTTTDPLSFSQTFTAGAFSTTFTAQAQSTYGSLHAGATASYNRSLTATDSRVAYASSLFRELLTVSSETLDGQDGTLTITFHLDGTIAESGTGNAFSYVLLGAGSADNPEEYGEDFFQFESSFDGVITLTVPIVYGREFLLTAALGAFAGSPQWCPEETIGTSTCKIGVMGGPAAGVGSGSALFFNTLELVGLRPTGVAGLVGDATFASGSGTEYGFEGVVPAPEPGSLVLFGTGLALVVLRRHRRRTNRSLGTRSSTTQRRL
jgi:hypothetical protein